MVQQIIVLGRRFYSSSASFDLLVIDDALAFDAAAPANAEAKATTTASTTASTTAPERFVMLRVMDAAYNAMRMAEPAGDEKREACAGASESIKSLKRDVKLGDALVPTAALLTALASEIPASDALPTESIEVAKMRVWDHTMVQKARSRREDLLQGDWGGEAKWADGAGPVGSGGGGGGGERGGGKERKAKPTRVCKVCATPARLVFNADGEGGDLCRSCAVAQGVVLSPAEHPPRGHKTCARDAEAFAAWLLQQSPLGDAIRRDGVLDVAGGSGELSMLLKMEGVSSTVVDPRACSGNLPRRQRKILRKSGTAPYKTVAAPFLYPFPTDAKDTSALGPLVESCGAVLGLHPDQATDAVVDAALALGKPFAVVPCCVFAREFTHRRLPCSDGSGSGSGSGSGAVAVAAGDRAVTSREDLIEYIAAKHPSIQRATIDCPGANVVLFSLGSRSQSIPHGGPRVCRSLRWSRAWCDDLLGPRMPYRQFYACSEEATAAAEAFVPRPSDVIVGTYSKTGTTLLQNLIEMLRSDGEMFDDV